VQVERFYSPDELQAFTEVSCPCPGESARKRESARARERGRGRESESACMAAAACSDLHARSRVSSILVYVGIGTHVESFSGGESLSPSPPLLPPFPSPSVSQRSHIAHPHRAHNAHTHMQSLTPVFEPIMGTLANYRRGP
jgi:hypothetical protein